MLQNILMSHTFFTIMTFRKFYYFQSSFINFQNKSTPECISNLSIIYEKNWSRNPKKSEIKIISVTYNLVQIISPWHYYFVVYYFIIYNEIKKLHTFRKFSVGNLAL